MVPDIEIQHLSVYFDTAQGPVYAVNDLSTIFRAGRISGVIGESGSGKSVMGMSLLRLLPNTARVTGKCFFGPHYHPRQAEPERGRGPGGQAAPTVWL